MHKHVPKARHAGREALFSDSAIPSMMGHAGEAWIRACLEYQREVARFASERIDGDIEHLKSMTQCRNPADLVKLQGEWATATLSDYAKEARQLMQIASSAMQDGIATAREAAETTVATRD